MDFSEKSPFPKDTYSKFCRALPEVKKFIAFLSCITCLKLTKID